MDASLVALASSGATALVQLLVTDAWVGVRQRFSTLVAASQRGTEGRVSERLERVRAELLQARDQGDEGLINDITVELRTWLRRLLEDHPELAEGISEFTGDADQFGEVSKIDIRENTFQGPSAVQGKGTQVNRFGI